jgi:outer membrane protein assembly factor BamB
MAKTATPLYVGTNRYVAAVDPRTGEELWRTKLPHAGTAIVTVLVGKAYLFVGHAGHVYCLDKRLGSIIWENGLPRMGFQPVLLASDADGAGRVKMLYIGTSRFVAALDPRAGSERWRTKLPHGSSAIVALLVEKDHLFVGHAGYLYCVAKRSGEIIWENGLPRMGFHAVIPVVEGVQGAYAASAAAAHRAEQQRRAAAAGGAAGS